MILCQDEHADAIDKSVFPFAQGGPLMHQVAAKAVSFKQAQKPSDDRDVETILRSCPGFS